MHKARRGSEGIAGLRRTITIKPYHKISVRPMRDYLGLVLEKSILLVLVYCMHGDSNDMAISLSRDF